MAEDTNGNSPYLVAIARSLGYLCIEAAELRNEPLVHAASLLLRLGFSRADCAEILDTTTDTIRVTMAQAKKGGAPTKSAKRKSVRRNKKRRA